MFNGKNSHLYSPTATSAKTKSWINGKFEWQTGFGAFSYSHSQLTNVINYIQNQEEHHKTKTFKEEYIGFLKAFEIDYNDKYIFEDL